MQPDNHSFVIWGGPLELALAVLAIAAWMCFPHRYIHHYPRAVREDIRAAFSCWRPGDTPDQTFRRYLEIGFGPLTNPTNRQKAFLSFFDPDLLAARFVIMSRTPAKYNEANIAAAARWMAEYRANLSPEERSALRRSLLSPAAQARIQQATTQYETWSADLRGATAPVFVEALATLKALRSE